MREKIAIAADHGGYTLKSLIGDFLASQGFELVDFGTSSALESVDYPMYAVSLSNAVASGAMVRGILVCGSGIGMSIAANKVHGVRAALVWDEYTARMSRQHNNANVLCLGARTINHDRALEFVKIWLETPFSGGRHSARLAKITELETQLLKRD